MFRVSNSAGTTEEYFKLKGNILLEEGFLEIMPWLVASDKEIPLFKVGETVDVKAIRIVEGKVSLASFFITHTDNSPRLPNRG